MNDERGQRNAAADGGERVEEKLGYRFRDRSHLQLALSHASSTSGREPDNERMEFLGDAVLGLVVCEYLFRAFPALQEGELTRIKSVLVQGETLAGLCRRLEIREHIHLGKGIRRRDLPDSVYANVFESLVAAIYRDGGYERAREFVIGQIERAGLLEQVVNGEDENSKARLQEYVQKRRGVLPAYRVLRTSGPEHGKTFEVAVTVAGEVYGTGRGRTKKSAEQAAAAAALERIEEKGLPASGGGAPGSPEQEGEKNE